MAMDQEKYEEITVDTHHHIGKSQNEVEDIGTFLSKNPRDPAIKVGLELTSFTLINQTGSMIDIRASCLG